MITLTVLAILILLNIWYLYERKTKQWCGPCLVGYHDQHKELTEQNLLCICHICYTHPSDLNNASS